MKKIEKVMKLPVCKLLFEFVTQSYMEYDTLDIDLWFMMAFSKKKSLLSEVYVIMIQTYKVNKWMPWKIYVWRAK